MAFRIRSATNGTYFRGHSNIGPIFGATKEDAMLFTSGWAAYQAMKLFPLVVDADLVNGNDVPCTIDGDPLRATRREA